MITKIYRAVDKVDGKETMWAVNDYGCTATPAAMAGQEWEAFEKYNNAKIWFYSPKECFSAAAIEPVLVRTVETSK